MAGTSDALKSPVIRHDISVLSYMMFLCFCDACLVNDPCLGAVHTAVVTPMALGRVISTQVNAGGFWSPVDNFPFSDEEENSCFFLA